MHAVQSHFLKHTACPKCGSKDNLALYSSGSGFCFGCGYYQRPTEILGEHPYSRPVVTERLGGSKEGNSVRSYPDDAVLFYPKPVVDWITKYDLEPRNLMEHNVYWSPRREQLLYTFYGAGTDVVLWQARNFKRGTTHKLRFFTGGSPEKVIAKYSTGKDRDTCCIVEDCISGIKVSYAGYDGVPCFGATMSKEKLAQLAKMYERVVVWLDHDKCNEATKIALQGAALGLTTRVVWTEADPKEHDIKTIRDLVK